MDKGGSANEAGESDQEENVARNVKGTHVLNSDGYFTLIDNRNYPNCRMMIKPRWHGAPPEGLGHKLLCKTLRPDLFGEDRTSPKLTYMLLRGWKIWRFQHEGFSSSSARQAYLQQQTAALRTDLEDYCADSRTTGSEEADRCLRTWVPAFLRFISLPP